SVHLEDWPEFGKELINEKLLSEMKTTRKICEIAHSLRAQAGIKVRQVLSQLAVSGCKVSKDLADLIKDELNVREVDFIKDLPQGDNSAFRGASWQRVEEGGLKIALNTEITPELREQGLIRELIRQINALRKQAGLTKDDQISVCFQTKAKQLENILKKEKEFLKKETISKDILDQEIPGEALAKKEIEIDGEKIVLGLRK
ncbi:hypothetical protein ISS21_02915, partial [Patescibacteria group bacterium]|nr:hypothetical protein [Patescibacteria group bacterium]